MQDRPQFRRPALDTCVFIDFLQGASSGNRAEIAREIFSAAEQGTFTIVASTMVIAELVRDQTDIALAGQHLRLDSFLQQPFLEWVTLDFQTARLARQLARDHNKKQVHDMVHLASAIRGNADCFLTSNTKHLPPGDYSGMRVAEPYFPYDRPLDLSSEPDDGESKELRER